MNKLIAITNLLINLFYFFPISFDMVEKKGGPFGYGIIVLFFTIPLNLHIIPAIISLLKKYKNSKSIFYLNFFACITLVLSMLFFKFILNY